MKEEETKANYSFIKDYRLNKRKEDNAHKLNWLFLPGGPGMGANYLIDFVSKLDLPGTLFIGDFPGDGDNLSTEEIHYKDWKQGLIEIVKELAPCVLVTHSFSGMFALTIKDLEGLLAGLVIINSAPDNSWMGVIKETEVKYNLPDISNDIEKLYKNPTDEQLKTFFYANIPYLFCEHEIPAGKQLLEISSYNIKTRIWGDIKFHSSYKYSWMPKELPTLIIGSHDDRLLPMKLFLENTKWSQPQPNINILELHDTGHFPWLSCFDEINEALLGLAEDIKALYLH